MFGWIPYRYCLLRFHALLSVKGKVSKNVDTQKVGRERKFPRRLSLLLFHSRIFPLARKGGKEKSEKRVFWMLRNQSRRSEVHVIQEKGRPFPITSGQSHFLLLLPPPHLILSGIYSWPSGRGRNRNPPLLASWNAVQNSPSAMMLLSRHIDWRIRRSIALF